MVLFQSLWSKPLLFQSEEVFKNYIHLAALSSIYAAQIGWPIRMHTDSIGYEILKGYPYLEIVKTLDNIPKSNPVKCLCAQGKFYALEQEELGNIHIDTDILLSSKRCFENWPDDSDIIIQFDEENIFKNRPIYDVVLNCIYDAIDDTPWVDGIGQYRTAYNVGTIGFKNQALKQAYLDYYMAAVQHMQNRDSFCWFDLVFEQQVLADLCKGYKVFEVLHPMNVASELKDLPMKDWANSMGYCHLLGSRKRDPKALADITNRLKEYSPQLLKRLDAKITQMYKLYSNCRNKMLYVDNESLIPDNALYPKSKTEFCYMVNQFDGKTVYFTDRNFQKFYYS